MSIDRADPGIVNPHYLRHLLASAQRHELRAAQDIVSAHGGTLLAKGSRIDAHAAERLLEHPLRSPLESCVQIEGGSWPEAAIPLAHALLERHALLRALCSGLQQSAPVALKPLKLSRSMHALLTVYAEHRDGRAEHMVGVALLSQSLARRLRPGQADRQRMLATAGLAHDVGELYVDPDHFAREAPSGAQAWREMTTHPLLAHRALRAMDGCGTPVAEAVLQHHERLEGFGYPRRLHGTHFTLDGQIVAVAEWLMALIESGFAPVTRASMAGRLVRGEFAPALLHLLADAARRCREAHDEAQAAMPLPDVVPDMARVTTMLERFRRSLPWADACIAAAAPPLRVALQAIAHRALRIHAYAEFCVDGADSRPAEPAQRLELVVLLREIEWRWRELERHALLRALQLGVDDAAAVHELLRRWR